MFSLIRRIFGTHNERVIKGFLPLVERVNQLEAAQAALSDAELRAQTDRFRERLANGESLDDLLPEAFAAVREAAKRTLGQRHYDVQLLGGIALHRGAIAEMKTGEGKTLVSTLPSYLNALSGRGVHIVTVNDYLAKRDSQWMGEVHRFLGLSVGVITHESSEQERRAAYHSDIAYITNNELGFDYLRDNMKFSLSHYVQRELHYAIVDEVDSILIDEARTPLIISGPSEQNTQLYAVVNRVIPQLKEGTKGEYKEGIEETGDYWVDEKHHSATLTEEGVHRVEKILKVENLYAPEMMPVLHAVNQALAAHTLKKRDVDYLVEDNERGQKEVVIIDEFTGRKMHGRRWSDGLHQAVEAKEGIAVRSENQTLATVTFQNFFRMYEKLAGMTGTADTEAPEFAKIYDLDVIVIPSNRPPIRKDLSDVVYKTKREKFDAVVEEIAERHAKCQPLLVGTISIENSEMLSAKLGRRGVKHNVLNAKHHAREAEIVAQAGRKDAVTISTNMAGRGTDIVLGGNPEFLALAKCGGEKSHPEYETTFARFEAECRAERDLVLAAGGLHIIGTERHESRRIDNQLRGRAGRQGDPGSSQFFLSLEDDLLRIFESDRVKQWWDRVGVEDGEAIENKLLTRVIENAQTKVEARNFDMRKHLLDYDDVMNRQRRAFYERRRDVLSREDVHTEVLEMTEGAVVALLDDHWPEKGEPSAEALAELVRDLEAQFGVPFRLGEAPFDLDGKSIPNRDAIGRAAFDRIVAALEEKKSRCDGWSREFAQIGYPRFDDFERKILLDVLDAQWKDHLHSMDGLRDAINLRGYAQKDPKLEYQREGYALFEEMNARIDAQALEISHKFKLPEPIVERVPAPAPPPAPAAQPQPVPRPVAPAPAARPVAPRPAAPTQPGLPFARPAALAQPMRMNRGEGANREATGQKRQVPKIGRNDPCPCGSGQKYKKCHGVGL
jgi:preprotein translocase subunit SecA